MPEHVVVDSNLKELGIETGTIKLMDGSKINYLFDPNSTNEYGFFSMFSDRKQIKNFVASKTDFDSIDTLPDDMEDFMKILQPIKDATFSPKSVAPSEDVSKPLDDDDLLRSVLPDIDPVAFETAAKIFEADPNERIPCGKILKKMGLEKLVSIDSSEFEVQKPNGDIIRTRRPFFLVTYNCFEGNFLPSIVIWDDEKTTFRSPKGAKFEDIRHFMYEQVIKRSQLGIGFAGSFAWGGMSNMGPKMGGNGLGPSGTFTFNLTYMKEYAKQRLEYYHRVTSELPGMETIVIPRSKE
jgi:hypothetical protein